MATQFNLTAQLQLQAPTNTRQIVNLMRRDLKDIDVSLRVKSNPRQIAQTSKSLQAVDRHARSSSKSMSNLNRTLQESARRFSVITIATGTMLALARSFKNSLGRAIEFEREIIRISQVTGKTVNSLQGLVTEVNRVATGFGVARGELLNVSRMLLQAGFSADTARGAMEVLGKTTLAPTFSDIIKTTEGAIAVLRQFGRQAAGVGAEVKFLERSLDAINAVSKQFAVESADLITAIRRTGGVFEAAGGSVNELIALFTSVRATTRESAETIATGLRTIFTRIQRTDTIDMLRDLGIQLQDSQGQFVGAYEAVRQLSAGLSALDPRDFRFSAIVEQLGGFRQVGKVIPLIRQFTVAQDALNVAMNASGSVAQDARTAQQGLAVQIQKLKESYDALVSKFSDSESFKSVAVFALKMADAFVKVADALIPLVPLLGSLFALKVGKSLAPGIASFAGIKGRAQGGQVHAFARGGFVPGRGNRDTVPAMLQPGEFVIRKSSASRLGAQQLQAMNNNRYGKGGTFADEFKSSALRKRVVRQRHKEQLESGSQFNAGDEFRNTIHEKKYASRIPKGYAKAGQQLSWQKFEDYVARQTKGTRAATNSPLDITRKGNPSGIEVKRVKSQVSENVIRDKAVRAIIQKQPGYTAKFTGDWTTGEDKIGLSESTELALPAKRAISKQAADALGLRKHTKKMAKKAAGGIIGDTVPALLTPGEFVVQRSAAQSIGYSNLNKMNTTGVARFAAGGAVARGRHTYGPGTPPGDDPRFAGIPDITRSFQALESTLIEEKARMQELGASAEELEAIQKRIVKVQKARVETITDLVKKGRDEKLTIDDLNKARERRAKQFNRAAVEVGGVKKRIRASDEVLADAGGGGSFQRGLGVRRAQADEALRPGGMTREGSALAGTDFFKPGREKKIARSRARRERGAAAVDRGRKATAVGGSGQAMLGSAQNFVFLTASAGALATQFSSMGGASKEATTHIIGLGTGLVGVVGTVGQLVLPALGWLATNSGLAAGMMGAVAAPLAILAVAALGVYLAFNWFIKKNKAQAAELEKSSDKMIQSMEEGGTNQADAMKQNNNKQMMLFAENQKLTKKRNNSLKGLAGGAVAGAAAGAAIGSFVPVFGTAVGAVAGGLIGLGIGFTRSADATNAEVLARQRQIAALNATTEAYSTLIVSSNKLKDDLAAIQADDSLTELQKVAKSREVLSRTESNPMANAAMAGDELADLAAKAGKSIAELKVEDLEEAPDKLRFKRATGQREKAFAELGVRRQQTSGLLGQAAQAEMTGEDGRTFAALMSDSSSEFARAMANSRKAIVEEGAAKIKASKDAIGIAAVTIATADRNTEAGKKAIAAAHEAQAAEKQKIQDINKNTQKTIADQDATQKRLSDQAEKNRNEMKREIAARKAIRESMERANKALLGISRWRDQIEKSGRAIDNFTAHLEGAMIDFSVPEIRGLDDVTDIIDIDKFNKQIGASVRGASPEVQASGRAVAQSANIFKQAEKGLVGKRFASLQSGEKINAEKILNQMGITRGSVGTDIFNQMSGELASAAEDNGGRITRDIFNKMMEPFLEMTEGQRRVLQENIAAQNEQLANDRKFMDALEMQRNKELEARLRILDTEKRAGELMASARGKTISLTQKDFIRQRKAQAGLRGAPDVRRGGRQLRAGDVRGAGATLRAARARQRQIGKEQLDADPKTQQRLQREYHHLNTVIKKTSSELERLANQSDRASDILGEIDKERGKREAVGKLVEEFVVGGAEQRQDLAKRTGNVRAATAAGSLQILSPEDRKGVVGLLDQLADVEIAGAGGLTGKQVKQELVFRDAIRMGMDPETARQIAMATTKEEQLISALEQLTNVMRAAAGEQARAVPPAEFAAGGSVFKPRGTDTVPAMLTPGEFVIRKSAVDKIGVSNLHALNNGGRPVYRQGGGPIHEANRLLVPNVSVVTGDQFKQQTKEIINNKYRPGSFAKLIGDIYGNEDSNRISRIKGSITKLTRDGRFDSNRLNAVRDTGTMVDWLGSQQHLFDLASGKGFRFKKNITVDALKRFGGTAKQMVGRKDHVHNRLIDTIYGRAGVTSPREQLVKIIRHVGQVLGLVSQGNAPGAGRALRRGRGDLSDAHITPTALRGIMFAKGGSVPNIDSVPAMLTPGEFVMNNRAVQKMGVPFMRSLNRGRIPGFRRGGLVGHGNVQYAQNGGQIGEGGGSIMELDPTRLRDVLDVFHVNLVSAFDNIVRTFSGVNASLSKLANAFTGLTMHHTFSSIDLMVTLGGAAQVSQAVIGVAMPVLEERIKFFIDAYQRDQENRTT